MIVRVGRLTNLTITCNNRNTLRGSSTENFYFQNIYRFLISILIERNNKYNKTITAKIAEGIAASLPNNVSAVTTENPELFMVSNKTCVIDLPGFIPIFLENNS